MTALSTRIASETLAAAQASRHQELEHLRWRFDNDALIILDLEAGQYHALDREGGQRFVEYAGGTSDTELEASLFEAGLVGRHRQKANVVRPLILPGAVPMAFKTLLVARRKLANSTFRTSLDWALAHRPRRPVPNAINAFRKAEAVFPSRLGDFDCLPRAIGLFAFLRHSALQPELIIGFKRHPFTAHAWVETNGEPVLESQTGKNRVALFREILRVC